VSALLGSLNLRGSYDASTIERWIADRRIDGLIFARCTRREERLVTQAREAQLPMVFIAPDENFAAGPCSSRATARRRGTLTEHLIALGHRRFAFLGGPRVGRRARAV
jgi:DNA-binding LacI/PurR family transcriptional regulator